MSNALWPHGLQHARLPCPSPSPGKSAQTSALADHIRQPLYYKQTLQTRGADKTILTFHLTLLSFHFFSPLFFFLLIKIIWVFTGIFLKINLGSFYFEGITNKVLLYSTENSAQCQVSAWVGGEFGGEWIHPYVWLSPFAVYLKLSQHC